MFRNLRFYRVATPWPDSEQELSEILSANTFKPCGKFMERSAGWESPGNDEDTRLCRRLNGADLLQLRTQTRLLPPAAVREALEDRVTEFRERTGEDPNRGEMRRLKEDLRDELLPKSLLKSERTRACFIHSESLLVIDAGTPTKAEWLVEQLQFSFPRFQCTPLNFNNAPEVLLKRIFLGDSPAGFTLGRECRFQDPRDSQSIGAWRNVELDDASIRHHVVEGMKLTRLGIGFGEIASFVLSDDGTISKFKFIEGESIDQPDDEDPLLRLDADFVLLTDTARKLAAALKKLLGGYAN